MLKEHAESMSGTGKCIPLIININDFVINFYLYLQDVQN